MQDNGFEWMLLKISSMNVTQEVSEIYIYRMYICLDI